VRAGVVDLKLFELLERRRSAATAGSPTCGSAGVASPAMKVWQLSSSCSCAARPRFAALFVIGLGRSKMSGAAAFMAVQPTGEGWQMPVHDGLHAWDQARLTGSRRSARSPRYFGNRRLARFPSARRPGHHPPGLGPRPPGAGQWDRRRFAAAVDG
jgi:hypothetical protein